MVELNELRSQLAELDSRGKLQLGHAVGEGLNIGDSDDPFLQGLLSTLPDHGRATTVLLGTQSLPSEQRVNALKQATEQLTPNQRKELVRELQTGIAPPRDTTAIWTIVVSAFAAVLFGSFVTVAVGVFVGPKEGAVAKPELVLSMFTSVVGFLAGLFVPSPAAKTASQ